MTSIGFFIHEIMKLKRTKIHKIRSKTNYGEFAKQSFMIAWNDEMDKALLIEKLVLTDQIESYTSSGYDNLKTFKGKALCRQVFSIKLKTLTQVLKWIESIKINHG